MAKRKKAPTDIERFTNSWKKADGIRAQLDLLGTELEEERSISKELLLKFLAIGQIWKTANGCLVLIVQIDLDEETFHFAENVENWRAQEESISNGIISGKFEQFIDTAEVFRDNFL